MLPYEIKAILSDGELNKLNDNFSDIFNSVTKIYKSLNDLILESGKSDMEVVQARAGERTLDARLDKMERLSNEVSSSLKKKANEEEVRKKGVPITLNDADSELLAAIQGGEEVSFNLLSDPRLHSVSEEKTTFVEVVSDNLFNKNDFIPDKHINGSTGKLDDNEYNNGVSGFIPVEPNTTYSKSFNRETGIAYYDEKKEFIKSVKEPITFTTPENAYYVRAAVRNDERDFFYINESDKQLGLDEYKISVRNMSVDYNMLTDDIKVRLAERGNNNTEKKSYYVKDPIPNGWYKAPKLDDHIAGKHPYQINTQDIYDSLEEVVDGEYVTKETLGKDTTEGDDIFKYEFKPDTMNINNFSGVDDKEGLEFTKKFPKIILHTGTHGEEKSTPLILANFLHHLVNDWEENELLEWIRWNVHLIVVPVTNPSGYNNNRKVNENGVDLNRNFDYDWEKHGSTDPEDRFYKGEEPFSEVESQYIRDLILDNTDAIAFYDYHMTGRTGNEKWKDRFWTILKIFPEKWGYEEMQKITMTDVDRATREAQKRLGVPRDSGFLGYVTYENPSNSPSYAFSKGIPSATLESMSKLLDDDDSYSFEMMQLCTEYLGNKIITTCRNFI